MKNNRYAILTSCNSRNAGGLCGAIAGVLRVANERSCTIDLFSYNDEFTHQDWVQYGKTINHPYSRSSFPILSSFGYSLDLSKILDSEKPELIDVQGLWMYHSLAALRYQKTYPWVKKVITPHGMLDQWAIRNSGWKKRIVGKLFEYENLRTADCFHALCKSEYESIRQFGLTNPVAIIPNGIDLPKSPCLERNKSKKVLLYIGRIHPKKGIKEMIKGVALLKSRYPNVLSEWTVRVAGWDQLNFQEELQQLSTSLGLEDSIKFIGPVFGAAKEKELCQADAFILTSFSEGVPMSILEAWAYRLPCIMTDFCNLPEGFAAESAIRVEPNPDSISVGLSQLMRMSDNERVFMGEKGFNLCRNKFTWKAVAEMKLHMYNWLLGDEDKPDFIIVK